MNGYVIIFLLFLAASIEARNIPEYEYDSEENPLIPASGFHVELPKISKSDIELFLSDESQYIEKNLTEIYKENIPMIDSLVNEVIPFMYQVFPQDFVPIILATICSKVKYCNLNLQIAMKLLEFKIRRTYKQLNSTHEPNVQISDLMEKELNDKLKPVLEVAKSLSEYMPRISYRGKRDLLQVSGNVPDVKVEEEHVADFQAKDKLPEMYHILKLLRYLIVEVVPTSYEIYEKLQNTIPT